jgi:hypothetical protein
MGPIKLRPTHAKPLLFFLRGRIWMEFEVPEVAAEFLRDARQLAKANEGLQEDVFASLAASQFPRSEEDG